MAMHRHRIIAPNTSIPGINQPLHTALKDFFIACEGYFLANSSESSTLKHLFDTFTEGCRIFMASNPMSSYESE